MPFTDRELAEAIADDQFRMLYQPLIDARTHQVQGVEALIRWQHPTRGLLAPNSFLPAMERSNLMERLTDWTLEEALWTCRHWAVQGAAGRISSRGV